MPNHKRPTFRTCVITGQCEQSWDKGDAVDTLKLEEQGRDLERHMTPMSVSHRGPCLEVAWIWEGRLAPVTTSWVNEKK